MPMSDHPTLLLTDVVDSTALAVAIGDDAMSVLWAAHDEASRALLLRWNGREMEKTDGLLALFDRTADAVDYALAYHEVLRSLPTPMSARVGIHFGALTLRPTSPEYVERGAKQIEIDGLAKPVVARVMSLALGGQTLLTDAARAQLGDGLHRMVSHGHWHLKGIDEPMELFEVGLPIAPFQPPPDTEKVYRVVRDPSARP